MEKEGINEEFIEKVKYCIEKGKFYFNNPIDIPSKTNYQTFFEAVRCGLPLIFVPEKMIDFNMAKLAINNHFNNVLFIPHNILNQELFDLALSQKYLPHLVFLQKHIPSEYLTNEVYEKYLRRDLKNNLKFVPETTLNDLQDVIDEINVKSKYEWIMNYKSEKEKLFERFDKIEEKEKNIFLRLYPHLKEEYQQFICEQEYLDIQNCIQDSFPYILSAEKLQSIINTCKCSPEQKKELRSILDKEIEKFQKSGTFKKWNL